MAVKKVVEEPSTPDTYSYTPLLVGLLVISAFINGMFINKFKTLSAAPTTAAPTTATAPVAPAAPQVTQDILKGLFGNTNITFGDKNSKNIFVEVADPSCPYCSIAAGHNPTLNQQAGTQFVLKADGGTYIPPVIEMKKLLDEGKAAFVWIYTNGHGNGELATKALYCAYEKEKFWPVHDKLMSKEGYDLLNNVVKNDKTKTQEISTFLSEAFDASEMKSCLDSGKYDKRIIENTTTAQNLGVKGTPGFFINTTNFAGAYSWSDMQPAVK